MTGRLDPVLPGQEHYTLQRKKKILMLVKYPSPNLGLIINQWSIQLKKAFLGTQKTIGNLQINKDRLEN